MHTIKDLEDIALQFVAYINSQDLEGLVSLMSEDFTMTVHKGEPEIGRERMTDGFRGYFSDFPDYRIHVEKVARCGNEIALVGKSTGSHVPAEIEEKETVVWIARLEDDVVAEWRIFSDMDQFN